MHKTTFFAFVASNGRITLRQLIAGQEPDGVAFPECKQADAVVLTVEDPLWYALIG